MSLQKRHIKNEMKKGNERKMDAGEFDLLLNSAVKFLNVPISKEICTEIFTNTDTDKDGLITYVEYFKAIEIYICKNKAGKINVIVSSQRRRKKEIPS